MSGIPGPSKRKATPKKQTKRQKFTSTFSQVSNTRRNVSKYFGTQMPLVNRPIIYADSLFENVVDKLPPQTVSWLFEKIRSVGIKKTQEFVLQEIFGTSSKLEMVSSGAYGTVYKATMTKDLRKSIKNTYANSSTYNRLMNGLPKSGTTIAIKIDYSLAEDFIFQPVSPNSFYNNINTHVNSTKSYLKRIKAEIAVGNLLYNFKGSRGHRGSQFFPKIYTAFNEPECGFAITVMEYIEGTSMHSYIRKGDRVPYKVLDQLSRAIETIWLCGFVHSDLHHKNIVVTKNNDVKVIDFGLARAIPKKTHEKVKKMIEEGYHIEDIWQKSGIGGWSNRNMAIRGYNWYNPNIYSARVVASSGQVNTTKKTPFFTKKN